MQKSFKKFEDKGGYYLNDFWLSPAYQSLSPASKNLLQCLYTQLKRERNKKYTKSNRHNKYNITNNGDISFTEKQFLDLDLPGCKSKETYSKACKQLIITGIIKRTHHGGNYKGDMSKYMLLFVPGIKDSEQRWRRFSKLKDWSDDIPKIKRYSIGNKSQWKPGECVKR